MTGIRPLVEKEKGDFLMLSEAVVYELKRMAIGLLIAAAVSFAVFCFIFGYENSILLGTLFGAAVAFLNYFFLAVYIERSVKKKKNAALSAMGGGYFLRMFFIAVMIYLAIKSNYINHWAMIVPLVFPRIIIMILSAMDSRKRRVQEE